MQHRHKALTLHEPWAMFVRVGLKRFETRSWQTSYRGPLLIHASANESLVDQTLEDPCIRPAFDRLWRQVRQARPDASILLHRTLYPGHVVALVELADVFPTVGLFPSDATPDERALGDWSPGRFAWKLDAIRPLWKPIRWRGKQGLWTAPPDLVKLVQEDLLS
jgi:activating signal cointegrator 1